MKKLIKNITMAIQSNKKIIVLAMLAMPFILIGVTVLGLSAYTYCIYKHKLKYIWFSILLITLGLACFNIIPLFIHIICAIAILILLTYLKFNKYVRKQKKINR